MDHLPVKIQLQPGRSPSLSLTSRSSDAVKLLDCVITNLIKYYHQQLDLGLLWKRGTNNNFNICPLFSQSGKGAFREGLPSGIRSG